MWPVAIEYVASIGWAYAMLFVAVFWFRGHFIHFSAEYTVVTLFSGWAGVVLATTCLLQIGVSLTLDSRYDSGPFRNLFWMIWYPIAYWMLNMAATVAAVPAVLFRRYKKRARWISPDRGIHT